MKAVVRDPRAAPRNRPYSPAVITDAFVLVSGQLGVIPETGTLAGTDIEAQTAQCLENIRALLREVGLDLSDLVKTTVFLTSMDDFKRMNDVYARLVPEPRPARSTVGVTLTSTEYLVEIEAMALRR